jgi:hypothetical protein
MERLTRRLHGSKTIKEGKADCAYCDLEFEGEDNHCSPNCSLRVKQLERLADYEDLGTPEELKAALADRDEEKRRADAAIEHIRRECNKVCRELRMCTPCAGCEWQCAENTEG